MYFFFFCKRKIKKITTDGDVLQIIDQKVIDRFVDDSIKISSSIVIQAKYVLWPIVWDATQILKLSQNCGFIIEQIKHLDIHDFSSFFGNKINFFTLALTNIDLVAIRNQVNTDDIF
jgi:hypothetical protein